MQHQALGTWLSCWRGLLQWLFPAEREVVIDVWDVGGIAELTFPSVMLVVGRVVKNTRVDGVGASQPSSIVLGCDHSVAVHIHPSKRRLVTVQ